MNRQITINTPDIQRLLDFEEIRNQIPHDSQGKTSGDPRPCCSCRVCTLEIEKGCPDGEADLGIYDIYVQEPSEVIGGIKQLERMHAAEIYPEYDRYDFLDDVAAFAGGAIDCIDSEKGPHRSIALLITAAHWYAEANAKVETSQTRKYPSRDYPQK